jgi:hypothetical protein
LSFGAAIILLIGAHAPDDDVSTSAERKAVAYLEDQVPAWHRENGCFSCHNNGDAARALYAATRRGFRLRADALTDTTAWLAQPEHWDENKGDPGYNDKRLANLQFAGALIAAFEAGELHDRRALRVAAQRIIADQGTDGAWQIEPGKAIGSPATYGTALATYLGLQTLRQAGVPGTEQPIGKADAWLRKQAPTSVVTAATMLLALTAKDGAVHDEDESRKRETCLHLIRRAQTRDGGWGPYVDSPPESFDTALVLLALSKTKTTPGETVAPMISRGRDFLAAQQMNDGSWRATTRPPGGESYAQSISTTAWATLALLETRQ